MEQQLVLPGLEIGILQQRTAVDPSVSIGEDRGDQLGLLPVHPHQLDLQPLGGFAERGVENVGGKAGHRWGSRMR
ncbi:hypothetical protein D3C72_2234830 [compost metagenome]